MLQFELLGQDAHSHARRGRLTLNHGGVETPNVALGPAI